MLIAMLRIRHIFLLVVAAMTGLLSVPTVAQDGKPAGGNELRIRQIFVPESEFKTPLARDREGVVLSALEYARLVQAAQQQLNAHAATHGQVIIRRSNYEAKADGDRLTARLTVDLDSAAVTWGQASIRVGHWQIERALLTTGDGPAETPLLSRSDAMVQVFLPRPGKHQLQLDMSLPLQAVGGDKAADIDLTGSASGTFSIVVAAGRNLLLEGSELPRPEPIGEAATYVLPTGGRVKLQLLLTDRQQTARSDVLTFASTAYGVNVAPGEVTWQARTSMQVFGRPIDQLVCTVPSSLEITDVTSDGLEAWELADAADGRTAITLKYRQPFEGTRRIQFHGLVSSRPEAPWTVPDLVLNGITSHVGTLVVSHPSGVRLQAIEARGVRAVMDLPVEDGLVAAGKHLMYQVWEERFALSFATSAKQQQVRAAMTNVLDIHRSWLDLFTTVNLESRFAPLFEARIQLPSGWMIVSVEEDGAPANWTLVPGEEGLMEVRIPLNQPLNPGESREISLTSMHQPDVWPVGTTSQTFDLPEVKLPQAGMVEALYGIVADDAFDIIPKSIVGLDPARQDDLNSLNQRLAGIGKVVRLGYAYQDTVFSGSLEVGRKPASIVANSVTFTRLDHDTFFAWLEAHLNVSGGGVRELQFSVAESAGTDLRFEVLPLTNRFLSGFSNTQHSSGLVRIVEQEASDPVDGMRTWTLKLDRYLVGPAMFRAVIQIPRDPAVADSSVPGWSVVGAEQQSGFLAVEAADDQRVRVTAKSADGAGLRSVDPIDFPPATYQPRERVVAAYQYLRPGWQVTIAAERFDRSPVPTAVAQHLQINSIVSATGEVQHAAELKFTAIGVQALLMRLPDDANLWSTLLNGQPVEVRKTENGYQVPLIEGNASNGQQLTLVYSTSGDPLERGGEFRSQPPAFAVVAGGGAEQSLEILDQEWSLSTPQSTLLFRSNGLFEPTQPLSRGVIAGLLENLMEIPDWSRFGAAAIAVSLVVVLLIGLRMFLIRVSHRWRWVAVAGLFLMAIPVLGGLLLIPASLQMRAGSTIVYDAELASIDAPQEAEMGEESLWMYAQPAAPEAAPTEEYRNATALDGISPSTAVSGRTPGTPVVPQNGADPFAAEKPSEPTSQPMDSLQAPVQANGPAPFAPGRPESRSRAGANEREHLFADQPPAPNDRPRFDDQSFSLQVQQSQQLELPQSGAVPAAKDLRRSQGGLTRGWDAGGGLLSITVQLQQPEDMQMHHFAYRGNGTGGELRVQYADQRACQMLLLCIASGVVLFGWWWLRNASWMTRSLWVLFTIAIPWALAPLMPVTGQLILEGVLWGGVVTVLLWIINALVQQCGRCCRAAGCCFSRMWPALRRTAGLWLMLCLLAPAAYGDEAKPASPPPAPLEPYVIIPYSPGQNPLNAERIFVPHELHERLWKAAHPEQQPQRPDVAASVVEALYAAKLVREGAARIEVQGRLTLIKSRPDRESVALPFKNVVVRSVTLDGEAATLEAKDQLRVSVESTGLHTIDVAFDVPVKFNGPAGEFRIALEKTPSASLVFDVPDQMKVSGSGTYRRLPGADGVTQVLIPVDQGGLVNVSWQPETQQVNLTGTVAVETTVATLVDDSGLSVNHVFHITPRQEAIQQLSFSITAGAAIRKISGQEVGGWEINEDGTSLKVFLRRPVNEPTQLAVDLFQSLSLDDKTATVAVPQMAPLDVTTETGLIGVFAGEQFVLRSAASTGVSQLDNSAFKPQTMPGGVQGVPTLTYRYVMRPFQLNVLLGRRPPESRAVAQHGVSIQRRKLTIASRLLFELTGSPRPSVSVELPPDYLPIDVAAPQLSDWYITTQDDRRILTLELEQPHLGSLPVVLEGRLTRDPESSDVFVELPVPLDVTRLDSSLGLWLNEGDNGVVQESENWRSIDPRELPADLRQLDAAAPQFAFRSNQLAPPEVELSVQSSSPELQADAVTLIAVTEATVDYGFTFRWKISRAAADEFQFTGPDWLAGRLEITAPGLREVVETELPDGRRLWSVSIIEPVRDQYLLTAVATLPSPEDQRLLTPLIQFQQGAEDALELLEFQRQYAILINLSTVQLVPDDPAQVESVTRDQLPLVVGEELVQQAMEVARVRPQRLPVWQLQRMDTQQDAAATVTGADLLTVMQADGSWRTRASYHLRNRGRQFLAVRIPEGSRLLSVMVADQPARAVTTKLADGDVQLIALPQTSEADLSFQIRLILAGELPYTLPGGTGLRARLITVPVPRVISPKESAEFGLTVAQTTWNVHFPDDFLVSPVNDVRQSNMTWNQGQQVWLASELNRLSALKADAMEMIRISNDSSASYTRRLQAKNNLKQIGLALSNYNDTYKKPSQELQDTNRELYEEVQKNLDVDGDGVQSFGVQQFDGSEQQQGRSFILGYNGSLFSSNTSGQQPKTESESRSDFNFRNQGLAEFEANENDKAPGKGEVSRAKLKSQLQEQSVIVGNSLNSDYSGFGGAMGGFGGGQGGGGPAGAPGMQLPNQQGQQGGRQSDEYQQLTDTTGRVLIEDLNQSLMGELEGAVGFTELTGGGRQAPAAWSAAGGLSLDLDLPVHGQSFSFSKVGGDPHLTFVAQPRGFTWLITGGLWGIVWLALGLWACHWLARLSGVRSAVRILATVLCVASLLGTLLLAGGMAWLCFAAFCFAGFVLVVTDPLLTTASKV